jgi:hypothetical protein
MEVDGAHKNKAARGGGRSLDMRMRSSSIVTRAGRKPPGVSAWPSIRVIADALLSALLSVIMLL